jgi:hypothetical protein
MRGFYSGLIAGIIGGIALFLYVIITQHLSQLPDFTSLDFWLNYFIYQIGLQGIFGGIFGIMYSKFYNGIPGKSIVKGLVFGLIIFLLGNFAYGTLHLWIGLSAANESHLAWGIDYFEGFPLFLAYGIALGPIYERLRL